MVPTCLFVVKALFEPGCAALIARLLFQCEGLLTAELGQCVSKPDPDHAFLHPWAQTCHSPTEGKARTSNEPIKFMLEVEGH